MQGNMMIVLIEFLNFITPMLFAALAVAIAMNIGLFNIGVSGQMLAAGFTATVVVGYSQLNGMIAKPLVLLIGIGVGAGIGYLIGVLKYRFNVSEVVSSTMLNYIMQHLISFYINKYYLDSFSGRSKRVSETARLIISKDMNGMIILLPIGCILAVVTMICVWFILRRSKFGCEMKSVAHSWDEAKKKSINVGKIIVCTMAFSGGLGGLAGVTYYLGYQDSIQPNVLLRIGFDAIAVSILGNNRPLGIIIPTILISFCSYITIHLGIRYEISSILMMSILISWICRGYVYKYLKQNSTTHITEGE